MVIPVVQGANAAPTALVADAHRAGLLVHPWTLRPENAFLPLSLKSPPAQDGARRGNARADMDDFLRRSEEHTSELQSQSNLVCRLLLEKKKKKNKKKAYRSSMSLDRH